MDYNDIFGGRASVRAFDKTRKLDEKELMDMLEAASHAPTTGNMQLYSVVLNMDPENIERLAALHLGQPSAKKCGAMLTFCADKRRYAKWCRMGDTESGFDNIAGDLTATMDACLFAQQFVAIAELHGLGTCYLGTVLYDLEGFCRELDLPGDVLPLFSVVIGYPAGQHPLPSDRLPVNAIVHRERYHDLTDEEIRRVYSEKEALPESAGFISENGKATLAQVYAEVRYPKDQYEKISESLKSKLAL